ncbi:MAG: hypothetical protein QM783_17525 [Phycisphaerales bacterium]
MQLPVFVGRAAVVAACWLACWSAGAQAQVVPLGRSSHLVSNTSDGSTPAHVDETYATWASDSHTWPAAHETITLGANSIDVAAGVDGYSYYNQMQHYGWTSIGSYTGDFTFRLDSPASYTLSGYLSTYAGLATLRLYNVETGVDIYTLTGGPFVPPFSITGNLPAGQYSLHIGAQGYGMEGGAGGVNLTTNLTFTPTPGGMSLAAAAAFAGARRRRRRHG